jgi:hypothetical protein
VNAIVITVTDHSTGVEQELQHRLEALAERLDERRVSLERARDSRCVFTCAYVLITRRIAASIPTAGYGDPAWIVRLAEEFASLYVEALDASARRQSAGEAWDAVFDAIDHRHSSVLEDLVLSMTAHIVHDLPCALERVGLNGEGASHIHDFHAVNRTMGEAIDEIETTIARRYAPGVRWLDHLGGEYSRILSNYGIRMSRGLAWYNANRIVDPASSGDARQSTARSVQQFVDEVTSSPVWTTRAVLRLGRLIVGMTRRWPRDPSITT